MIMPKWLLAMTIFQQLTYEKTILDKNISNYCHKTGEPIAVSHLIKEYEADHCDIYMEEVNGGYYLEWEAVENKDLNDYCRRYLHQCVPRRSTWKATGSKEISKLRYTTLENKLLEKKIVVVTCLNHTRSKVQYYITRAYEPHCVYALRRDKGSESIVKCFSIVYKHCNIEQQDYRRKEKHYRNECDLKNCQLHYSTGQRIASDHIIEKYELEHQVLHKKETGGSNFLNWPFVTTHDNLNEYCNKYMEECTFNRNIKDVVGSWKWEKIKWKNSMEISTQVVVVKCFIPCGSRRYYFTRAPESNCVYALLRKGKVATNPFQIVFKYCNFDVPNIKRKVPGNSGDVKLNTITHNVKAEEFATPETSQFFSSY